MFVIYKNNENRKIKKLYVTGQGKLELKFLSIPAEVFVKKKKYHDFQLPFFLEMWYHLWTTKMHLNISMI